MRWVLAYFAVALPTFLLLWGVVYGGSPRRDDPEAE